MVHIQLSKVERQMEGKLDHRQQMVDWMKGEFIKILKLRKAITDR